MIYNHYPDSLVEVWMVNRDASVEWLNSFVEQNDLTMPFIQRADEGFDCYRLGVKFRTIEPLFIVIDKRGIIRHRSFGRRSITIEEVAEMMAELLVE